MDGWIDKWMEKEGNIQVVWLLSVKSGHGQIQIFIFPLPLLPYLLLYTLLSLLLLLLLIQLEYSRAII
jgi:hypothetical protein